MGGTLQDLARSWTSFRRNEEEAALSKGKKFVTEAFT
jgi:hypothetical protein